MFVKKFDKMNEIIIKIVHFKKIFILVLIKIIPALSTKY